MLQKQATAVTKKVCKFFLLIHMQSGTYTHSFSITAHIRSMYLPTCVMLSPLQLGMSTANLIGLNHQDVPSLVLQMLLCIGNEGAIIPKGMKLAPHLENLDVIVVRSGMRALNYFYNLRRQSFSKPDQIERLKRESASLHYDMTQLWRAKQLILKTTGNYGGKITHVIIRI